MDSELCQELDTEQEQQQAEPIILILHDRHRRDIFRKSVVVRDSAGPSVRVPWPPYIPMVVSLVSMAATAAVAYMMLRIKPELVIAYVIGSLVAHGVALVQIFLYHTNRLYEKPTAEQGLGP